MANEQKSLAISTIPIPKLTVLMNNFICNTVTHLNKLSVKGDEKLAEFDKKLNDLEIMTTLLEAKLNSIPEKIRSTYPPIEPTSLDDVNPVITNSSGSDVPVPPPEPKEPVQDNQNLEKEEEENEEQPDGEAQGGGEDLPPEEELENFLKSHENLRNLSKMLKYGAPIVQLEQKAKINGFDMDLVRQLIELARKVYPNIN